MIAVASGITGVGIARAKDIAQSLGSVHIFPSTSNDPSSFSILIVVTYFVSGFFFMYFFRKLALNPALAKAGRTIERLTVTGRVDIIETELASKIRPSLLLGREGIEELEDLEKEDAELLRKDLFHEEVNRFLDACEEDARTTAQLLPQNIAIAARLHYYRVYFEKEGTPARLDQEVKATDWIHRALMRDPTNPDLQTKLADILQMQGSYAEAVAIIERLEREDSAPQFIEQWLGYFLLLVGGRERDAIRHSQQYFDRFPDSWSALYNVSCAYAQLYAIELREKHLQALPESENRLKSLELLAKVVANESDFARVALKHSEPTASFDALVNDSEFMRLTAGSGYTNRKGSS